MSQWNGKLHFRDNDVCVYVWASAPRNTNSFRNIALLSVQLSTVSGRIHHSNEICYWQLFVVNCSCFRSCYDCLSALLLFVSCCSKSNYVNKRVGQLDACKHLHPLIVVLSDWQSLTKQLIIVLIFSSLSW